MLLGATPLPRGKGKEESIYRAPLCAGYPRPIVLGVVTDGLWVTPLAQSRVRMRTQCLTIRLSLGMTLRHPGTESPGG